MLQIRIISPTNNKIVWPTTDADVITLAQTYIAHETTLAPGEQLAGLTAAVLQAQLALVMDADAAAKTAEDDRAYQANLLAQTLEQVKTKIAQATLALKTKHFGTEAILEQWGYDTTVGKDGKINVRQPKTLPEVIAFLTQYVDKENSLHSDDRLTAPTLADMTALATSFQAATTARNVAQAAREAATDTRGRETRKLLYLVQVACAEHVLLTYNGLITNDLEKWGFKIERPTPTPTDPPTP